MRELQQNIKGCPPPIFLSQAGHFVQEHGQSIAESAVQHFKISTT
jgi:tRNA(adenine34) deaminase